LQYSDTALNTYAMQLKYTAKYIKYTGLLLLP
jgi:hypothetical protein